MLNICFICRNKLWFSICIWVEVRPCSLKWGFFVNLQRMTIWYSPDIGSCVVLWWRCSSFNHQAKLITYVIISGAGVGNEFSHCRWHECDTRCSIEKKTGFWNVGKAASDRHACWGEGTYIHMLLNWRFLILAHSHEYSVLINATTNVIILMQWFVLKSTTGLGIFDLLF